MVALFGYVSSTGQIRNLGLPDVLVDGYDYVAALAGCNEGSISRCYATGTIQGHYYPVCTGGLVARNLKGTISNCYSRADVAGDEDVGGLVGSDDHGLIVNCYAAGSVSADFGGPLLGDRRGGSVQSSYHCCALAGESWFWNEDGAALTQTQAMARASYLGWDFEQVWSICEGKDYPRLRWEQVTCGD